MAFRIRKTLWPARLPGLRRLWSLGRRGTKREAEDRPSAPPEDVCPEDVAWSKVDEAADTLVASGALDSRREALIALRSAVDSALSTESGELEEAPAPLMLAPPPPVEFAPRPSTVRRFLLALSGRRIRVRKMQP